MPPCGNIILTCIITIWFLKIKENGSALLIKYTKEAKTLYLHSRFYSISYHT